MKNHTKFAISTSLDAIWIGSLFLGLLWQHENLINVGLFMTWFSIFINLILALADSMPDPGNARLARSVIVDVIGAFILIWYGYLFAAAILVFSVMLYSGRFIKDREKLEEIKE